VSSKSHTTTAAHIRRMSKKRSLREKKFIDIESGFVSCDDVGAERCNEMSERSTKESQSRCCYFCSRVFNVKREAFIVALVVVKRSLPYDTRMS
jgi:hypothetical protein